MSIRGGIRSAIFAAVVMTASLAPVCRAQDENKGIIWGTYNVQQSVEAGYRQNWVNGDQATYDTFVNYASGLRLLDYTLDMRSIDHNGFLFDNLSFSNFGYGGDPNDVTRLRVNKNKWYDFRGLFRRDKNNWDWRLLANPFNPASTVVPAPPIATPILASPHALDLVRRMQDYNLTLFPQSRLRFRVGYSHYVNEGPAFTTLDGGTEPLLNQNVKYTSNSYRAGVDFRVLPRTTLSYDQFLVYNKQDTFTFDHIPQPSPLFNNGAYQIGPAGGPFSPVDLGIVWAGNSPCAAPITNPATTPPTVRANCNGYFNGTFNGAPLPGYSNFQKPRVSLMTERFSFQSAYFHKFEMSGAIGYSSGDNTINDYLETVDGFASRTAARGSLTSGPAKAKRISVNADWSGVYSLTDKLRLVDTFRFDNFRIPGIWNESAFNLFNVPAPAPPPVLNGMLLPISTIVLTPGNFGAVCPPPFTGANCPQHSSSSLADFENQVFQRFLGQDLKSNTFQVQYDFTRRLSGRIGYQYTHRQIANFTSIFDVLETYFPGGGGNAANHFLAARADCSPVAGAPLPNNLPPNCTLNADGSVSEVGPDATFDTARNVTTINENLLLAGITARPIDKLRITGDFGIGYNDNSFTRTSPRQVQSYKVHASYRPQPWATIDGGITIHENRDNVSGTVGCPTGVDPALTCPSPVNNLEHDRTYSFNVLLSPNPRLSVDFGYNYWDYYTQIDICYASGVVNPGVTTTPCPSGSGSPVPLGAQSVYSSTSHYPYANMMWKVMKRVTVGLGLGGNFVRGTSLYFNQPQFAAAPAPALGQVSLNTLSPTGTLDFNYLNPHSLIAVDIYKGLSYKMAWNYYGFNTKGPSDPTTLAPLGSRDYNGSTGTFSLRYVF